MFFLEFKLGLEEEKNNRPVYQTQGRYLLYTMILNEIENMFSFQNDFFKALVDSDPHISEKTNVFEAPQKTRYVRNLIGHEIGLPDKLYFDPLSNDLPWNLT